jgi:hypothetical protein
MGNEKLLRCLILFRFLSPFHYFRLALRFTVR